MLLEDYINFYSLFLGNIMCCFVGTQMVRTCVCRAMQIPLVRAEHTPHSPLLACKIALLWLGLKQVHNVIAACCPAAACISFVQTAMLNNKQCVKSVLSHRIPKQNLHSATKGRNTNIQRRCQTSPCFITWPACACYKCSK